MTDAPHLDAAADGAFSGKLADPADTLTKRGGKGIVVYDGQEYDRLAWTRRCAERGYTLAAGEGALLLAALIEAEQECDALKKVYKAAAVYCGHRTIANEHALIDAVGEIQALAVQPLPLAEETL